MIDQYAKVLFKYSKDRKTYEVMQGMLEELKYNTIVDNILSNSMDPLRTSKFLYKTYTYHNKDALLDRDKNLGLRFIVVIVRFRMFKYLDKILDKYLELINRYNGIQKVIVAGVADAISSEEEVFVNEFLKSIIHANEFYIEYQKNDFLISGFRIEFDNKTIDLSLKKILEKFVKL